jgi:transcriptional regulator with XRE-family HTH domain
MRTLQAILRERGISQKALADVLDVSEPSVSRWANREADIPARHIQPIADYLKVSASDVLGVATRPVGQVA